ncbi:MAG: carboxymuconolactone decarboxylase family protein [Novosphingobium sp.]
MSDKPRLPPIPARQWSDAAREAIAILSPEASQIGLDPSDDTHVHNLPSTQLHHPELMKSYFPFLQFLLWGGTLPARYRELAILRVAWLRQAEYEWTQHVLIARSEGISDADIRRIAGTFDPGQWEPADALVIRAVGELIESACLSNETWTGLTAHLDAKQLIELIHVVGNYDLIAMFMKSTGMELEDNLEDIRFEAFADS